VIDCALGCVVTEGGVHATFTVNVPMPSEKSPAAAVLLARTVNGVELAGVAAVVLMVSVDVVDVSAAAKLTVLGLNEAVPPVGSEPVRLRSALNAVPAAPFRLTVTV
jgi:hypothetical protein